MVGNISCSDASKIAYAKDAVTAVEVAGRILENYYMSHNDENDFEDYPGKFSGNSKPIGLSKGVFGDLMSRIKQHKQNEEKAEDEDFTDRDICPHLLNADPLQMDNAKLEAKIR